MATMFKNGNVILGTGEVIEKGKLADLIVIDGNPLDDISLLQKKDKILAIMEEGYFYKCHLQRTIEYYGKNT
jgi:imidazolonepropionase-like amidohydrolase